MSRRLDSASGLRPLSAFVVIGAVVVAVVTKATLQRIAARKLPTLLLTDRTMAILRNPALNHPLNP